MPLQMHAVIVCFFAFRFLAWIGLEGLSCKKRADWEESSCHMWRNKSLQGRAPVKCKRCKAEAVVGLRSHNAGFCPSCYMEFFSRQVERGIASQKLFTHEERILVALSGGKDSLTLMLELQRLGYDVTALHIDLGIPDSSVAARACVERFCARHRLRLMVREMAAEGLAIPQVKAKLRRPVCSACGKIKRYFFNRIALEEGFDVLATGHNLDDETARLFSNTLRWDGAYLAGQGPRLESAPGFVRKVKPLWRLSEFEIANYAYLMGIEVHSGPCPYSPGASFTVLKHVLHRLESAMPGRKLDFYQGFLARGRPVWAAHKAEENLSLRACTACGSPTSSGDLCGVCHIRQSLRDGENSSTDRDAGQK
jgi:uncharacterized protein (TIGR00269 family)